MGRVGWFVLLFGFEFIYEICFGRWDVSVNDISRSLKCVCFLGGNILYFFYYREKDKFGLDF